MSKKNKQKNNEIEPTPYGKKDRWDTFFEIAAGMRPNPYQREDIPLNGKEYALATKSLSEGQNDPLKEECKPY